MNLEQLREEARKIPFEPGVYQFFDEEGVVIYVGKAKSLRKRVLSYFSKKHEYRKTQIMVSKIREIKHVVVETEQDALLLENTLIKEWQPKYNIRLKDDKTYPWICVKKEPFPRVFVTRNVVKDGSKYYGPYTSVKMVRAIMGVINTLYKLRTCSYWLSEENITQQKYKVCLEYHINNCLGGCEGYQSEADYQESIEGVHCLLSGNLKVLIKMIEGEMRQKALDYCFEEAQKLKEQLEFLRNYQSRSTVVNPRLTNVDVFSYVEDEQYAYVNFLKLLDGRVVHSYTLEVKKQLEEEKEEVLAAAIVELGQRIEGVPKERILPFELDFNFDKVLQIVPQRGEKLKLLSLSKRNALYYKKEQDEKRDKQARGNKAERLMQTMKQDLRMAVLPKHIECFDNSNIQGTSPVASCVVFREGKPSKREYRKFHIKTVEGPDDFASMKEVLHRRYKRMLSEGAELPQLIIIDGGKGQLGAAMESLNLLGVGDKIAVIGIAKRLEEIFCPGDSLPLYLDKRSETLRVIQYLRNEAHRFAITFHRDVRSGSAILSELDEIKGVGAETQKKLLRSFRTVEKIKQATEAQLSEVVGKSKAKIIKTYFSKEV